MSVLQRQWIELNEDSLTFSVGGLLIRGLSVVALNIGDSVMIDDAGLVDKSATAGEQVSKMGVVVGGESTSMEPYTTDSQVGNEACDVDEQVLVCILGICHIITEDGSVSAIGMPLKMGVSAAGKIVASTDLTDDAAIGINLETGAPGTNDHLKSFITQA